MNEKIEKEWLERNRYQKGKPIGYRQYITELSGDLTIEEVILEVEKSIKFHNNEKGTMKDEGVFSYENLEDVNFSEKDFLWHYVVSMQYIHPKSSTREKCQKRKNGKNDD